MANRGKFSRKITQDNFVTEKIDVIKNNLLGSYDDKGNYIIATQIIHELLTLKKIKKNSFGNSIFCVGNLLGYGEIVFELLFDAKTHNGKSASATLYLLEDVDKINGYLQNTIKTKLEDFNEEVEDFIEETYRHFNIFTDDEDDSEEEGRERKLLDDLDNEDSFIVAKKQYSLLLDKLLDEKFLDAYGKYFTSRISALTKLDNEFSKAVLNSFNNQHNLIENVFLQEKNYKTLNELLDKCIEEVSGTNDLFLSQEKQFNELTAPALETFVDNVNKLNDRFETKALNMLDKSDREKVEEILEEQAPEEESKTYESKPSVEQIVNEVKTAKQPEEQPHIESQEKEEEDSQLSKESEYIKDILDKKKQEKVEEAPEKNNLELGESKQEQQSFYESFKDAHTSVSPAPMATKVVDTAISRGLDAPESEGETAVLSLKDRIRRLEKFKESSSVENEYESVFDNLSKHRSQKDIQIEEKNAKTREQLAQEYFKRQQRISSKDEMER